MMDRIWRWRMAAVLAGMLAFSGLVVSRCVPATPSTGPTAPLPPAAMPATNMAWRAVALGAGGYITGLDTDAAGTTLVARTDVYGAYRWDSAAKRWVQLVTSASMPGAVRPSNGQNAGVYEIAVAPSQPSRLYMVYQGRLFRSDDAGRTWWPPQWGAPFPMPFDANNAFRFYGPFVAVAPQDPNLLLLGTPANGLWRSADGGLHWQVVASVPHAADLRPEPGVQAPGITVWFDPKVPGRVLAGSAGHGIWASTDKGEHFAPLGTGGPATVIRAGFDTQGAFWAAENESGHAWVWASQRWTDLTASGILPKKAWAGVAVAPGSAPMLMTDDAGFVWCSANGGSRWQQVLRRLRIAPGDPAWLKVANGWAFASAQVMLDPANAHHAYVASGVGPFEADLGANGCPIVLEWASRLRGIEELVANDITQPPGQAPLFSVWDFGIHRKDNLNRFGESFGPRERLLIAAQQVEWSGGHPAFLVTNASDTRQCCEKDGQSVLAGYSEDGGRSWQRFATLPHPPGTQATDPWAMAYGGLAVSADDTANIVWEPARYRTPFYTLDRGASWHPVHFAGEVGPLTGSYGDMLGGRKSLVADRVAPGTFYLLHNTDGANAGLAGLWRSTDKGAHWARVFAGEIAPNSKGFVRLRAVPGHAGHLFLTAGVDYGEDQRLRLSVDGGAHWQAMDGVEAVTDVAFGKPLRPRAYPALYVAGKVRGQAGIWRSVDKGQSWQQLAQFPLGWLATVAAIEADKDVFGRVYVGYVGGGALYGQPEPCAPHALAPGDTEQCWAVPAAIKAGS